MAVILCFTRLETIILCSPPLLWQTARASAEMISNRFSKMLSTRLPPYIISFQWAENKNLIHKSIATSIRCTLVHILFCSIKILYCLYPLRSVYIDGCAAGKRLTQGSIGVKRQLALCEGNLVSGALMIMGSVKRALPDPTLLAVAPLQAPRGASQTEGGMWSGKKRREVSIRTLSWMNSLPAWFFFLSSCSAQLRLSLPKEHGAILFAKPDPLSKRLEVNVL